MTARRRLHLALLAGALVFGTTSGAQAVDEPLPVPREGCTADLVDPAGDASYTVSGQKALTDNKLDVTDVMLGTKGRTAFFYFKMPNYQADNKTSYGFGPRWDIAFDVDGTTAKGVRIIYAIPDDNYKRANTTSFPLVYVNGSPQTGHKITPKFDTATKSLLVSIDLDDLATRTGATPTGTKFNNFSLQSAILADSITTEKAANPTYNSAAEKTTVFDRVPDGTGSIPYVVGMNKCFAPPPSKLAALTGTTVQFGDVANVSAKLTDEPGTKAVAGKTLTFAIAGKSVTATTGADGVAKAVLAHGKTAGGYPLTVSFAGDDSYEHSELAGTLTVKQETAKISMKVTGKSGKNRTVTVNVADDDRAAVAGQYVNWYVNGKKGAPKKTDAKGNVAFAAAAGQTVVAELPAVSGKYLAVKTGASKLA